MSESATADVLTQPFGSVMAPVMATASTRGGAFVTYELGPTGPLALHPAAHALHYGSACFEGLKAHRGADDVVRLFRVGDHARRLRDSAAVMCLPPVDVDWIVEVIHACVAANLAVVPPAPGALYVRPTLLGTDPNIGSATHPSAEALLYVLCSPVGDYLASEHALTLGIETHLPRTTPQFGAVKAGANYAMALGPTLRARAQDGTDQLLFAPGGQIQEAGPANFLLIEGTTIITPALDGSFLAGITRDSILTLAEKLGYRIEDRALSMDEVIERAGTCEAALIGTAAVLAGVGSLVHDGQRILVGDGRVGPHTRRLRDALVAVQRGETDDEWGWTNPVH